jgi:hypothetical protein
MVVMLWLIQAKVMVVFVGFLHEMVTKLAWKSANRCTWSYVSIRGIRFIPISSIGNRNTAIVTNIYDVGGALDMFSSSRIAITLITRVIIRTV